MSEFFDIGIECKTDIDVDRDIIARLKEAHLVEGYIGVDELEPGIPRTWFEIDGREAFVIDWRNPVDQNDRTELQGTIPDITFDLSQSRSPRKSRLMILNVGELLSDLGDLTITDTDYVIARTRNGGPLEEFAVGRGRAT